MQPTFKSLEHQGWSERAAAYDDYTARMTKVPIAPLLDAAGVRSGTRVLDVCCGTGIAAEEAVRRGAAVTGVDLSEDMIAAARGKGLKADFRTGDAETLPFADTSFDSVVCNFGILHLPDPARAMAEVARVLAPGGRYAYATWRGPEVSPFYRVILGALSAHGTMEVGLPPAPPPFRFGDPAEAEAALREAGFDAVACTEVPNMLECPADAVIDFIRRATVRMTLLIEAQKPEARVRVEQAIREGFRDFTADGMLRVPIPVLVASGRKPG